VHTIATKKHAKALDGHWTHADACRVYIQVHTSHEETKSGCAPDETVDIAQYIWTECKHLQLAGLMTIGIPSRELDLHEPNPDFDLLAQLRDQVTAHLRLSSDALGLSMGMSDDYLKAIGQGSTCVRVGSSIFGHRQYHK